MKPRNAVILWLAFCAFTGAALCWWFFDTLQASAEARALHIEQQQELERARQERACREEWNCE